MTRDEEINYGDGKDTNDPTYGDGDDNNANVDDARESNPIMNKLPDHYLCEGSPDKMMMDALKELNINDIRDFLQEESPNSQPFEKKTTCATPQISLRVQSW